MARAPSIHPAHMPRTLTLWMVGGSLMAGCASKVVEDVDADVEHPTFIAERITEVLPEQALTGICLPHPLLVDAGGRAPCSVLEVRDDPACDCTRPGRAVPDEPYSDDAIDYVERDPTVAGLECICELEQLQGPSLEQCQSGAAPSAEGWCYVDSTVTPPLGDATLTARCAADEQRLIRFTPGAPPEPGSVLFLACAVE
ncbi:MAG: hypothetical protein U0271_27795 [Polyangiaceae bacterium]